MRCLAAFMTLAALTVLAVGCGENNKPPPAAPVAGPGAWLNPEKPGEKPAPKPEKETSKGLKRVIDRTQVMSELRQIAIALNQYADDFRKLPKTKEEVVNYLGVQGGAITAAFKDGYYVLNPNARRESSSIWVTEAYPDDKGLLYVVKGDGSVTFMTNAELKAELGK
ncbi:MAG: DUF1559 domain-containing protein [Gemmataceae bacterium]|nr:DUF1559 domain-containing protein [Gemmataceae bacterium]MCI0740374.1 DUF1559 domain-containing protein [Gemmataceae bacterium]